MGIILELARARQRIAELEKLIVPDPPEITRLVKPVNDVSSELFNIGLSQLYRPCDFQYVYTDSMGWIEVISYIYTYMPMPAYFVKPDGTWNLDCEDWAIWFKAMVSLNFGLNYCGLVYGAIPQGEHGFNLLRDEEGPKLYEPQPSQDINYPFYQDENGYHARDILM